MKFQPDDRQIKALEATAAKKKIRTSANSHRTTSLQTWQERENERERACADLLVGCLELEGSDGAAEGTVPQVLLHLLVQGKLQVCQ